MAGRLTIHRAKIANGASLSGELLQAPDHEIVAIQMPASWTAANLTFQSRSANEGAPDVLQNVFDSGGTEVAITAAAGRYIVPTGSVAAQLAALDVVKVRSGTSGVPVNQGAEREILLICKPRGV